MGAASSQGHDAAPNAAAEIKLRVIYYTHDGAQQLIFLYISDDDVETSVERFTKTIINPLTRVQREGRLKDGVILVEITLPQNYMVRGSIADFASRLALLPDNNSRYLIGILGLKVLGHVHPQTPRDDKMAFYRGIATIARQFAARRMTHEDRKRALWTGHEAVYRGLRVGDIEDIEIAFSNAHLDLE
jgi:hypothetical protein